MSGHARGFEGYQQVLALDPALREQVAEVADRKRHRSVRRLRQSLQPIGVEIGAGVNRASRRLGRQLGEQVGAAAATLAPLQSNAD